MSKLFKLHLSVLQHFTSEYSFLESKQFLEQSLLINVSFIIFTIEFLKSKFFDRVTLMTKKNISCEVLYN